MNGIVALVCDSFDISMGQLGYDGHLQQRIVEFSLFVVKCCSIGSPNIVPFVSSSNGMGRCGGSSGLTQLS